MDEDLTDEALKPEGVEDNPTQWQARIVDLLLHAGERVGEVRTWPFVASDGNSPSGGDGAFSGDLPTLRLSGHPDGRVLRRHQLSDNDILQEPVRESTLAIRADDETFAPLHVKKGWLDAVLQRCHPAAIARCAGTDSLIEERHRSGGVEVTEAHRESARAGVPFEVVTAAPLGIDVLVGVGRSIAERAGTRHEPKYSLCPPAMSLGIGSRCKGSDAPGQVLEQLLVSAAR